jgi:hypothetical protein
VVPRDDTALNEQNALDSALTQIVGVWQASEAAFLSYIFSGAGNALSDLHKLISNGVMIPTPPGGLSDFQNQAIKILYGMLIPRAWSMVQGAKPFVLYVVHIQVHIRTDSDPRLGCSMALATPRRLTPLSSG